MGILGTIFRGGIKDSLNAAGGLLKDAREMVTGEEQKRKLFEIEAELAKAQAEITKAEAQSSRFFVAGARPMILWICAAALAMNFLIAPILGAAGVNVPTIDLNMLYPLMLGMLGLGAYRTYEKVKKVQNQH